MGFRDPITTIAAVDSTDGQGGAGVVITGARATWGDGGGGFGYIEAHSSAPTDPLGSHFDVAGPWFGTLEPKVEFGSAAKPAGGYQSTALIQADRILQPVATDPIVAATALTVTSAFFTPYLAGYRSPTFTKLASGQVVVFGTIKVTSVSFGAGQLVATLPAGCRPLASERFILSGWSQTWTVDVGADGTIRYASAGSGGSIAVGSLLSLAGITFPGEQ